MAMGDPQNGSKWLVRENPMKTDDWMGDPHLWNPPSEHQRSANMFEKMNKDLGLSKMRIDVDTFGLSHSS